RRQQAPVPRRTLRRRTRRRRPVPDKPQPARALGGDRAACARRTRVGTDCLQRTLGRLLSAARKPSSQTTWSADTHEPSFRPRPQRTAGVTLGGTRVFPAQVRAKYSTQRLPWSALSIFASARALSHSRRSGVTFAPAETRRAT